MVCGFIKPVSYRNTYAVFYTEFGIYFTYSGFIKIAKCRKEWYHTSRNKLIQWRN